MAYEKKSLTAMREEYDAKAKNLHDIFVAHPDIEKMPADVALKIRPMNDELGEISAAIEEAEVLVGAKSRAEKRFADGRGEVPDAIKDQKGGAQKPVIKTLDQIVSESAEYKSFLERGGGTARFELSGAEAKTLLTLTNGGNVQADRLPGFVPYIVDGSDVSDLFLQGSTDSNVISYYEETTYTNSAAEVAEGEVKPESAFAFTERTENVRKIATWIPVTTEALMDVPGMQSTIEGRMGFMVKMREAGQLLTGNGTAPNISGILDRSIQSQAKGVDPTPDAVYKAMQKVRVTGEAEPTAVVFHPNDWTDVRLLRTADGVYIWGNPSEAGPERIWGKEIRQTPKMTENTALVGAFKPHAQVFRRQGLTITVSTEHSDYFIYNKVAILAEERLALAVYRPYAFCQVTGL